MPRTIHFLTILAFAGATAFAADAFAQAPAQPSSDLDEAARLTFESARQAFAAGDYETALARFRQAYQLSPRPGLLYNIAQSLDRLRRDEETLAALREYLAALPDAPNRSEVEARIRVLERTIVRTPPSGGDGGGGEVGGGGGTTPPARDPLAILHPAVFISVGGLAVVSGALLIWSGVETLSLNKAYNETTNYNAAFEAYRSASDQQLLTNVFVGVTAGLGVAAAALAVITDWGAFGGGGGSASVTPIFRAGPEGALLGLGASF